MTNIVVTTFKKSIITRFKINVISSLFETCRRATSDCRCLTAAYMLGAAEHKIASIIRVASVIWSEYISLLLCYEHDIVLNSAINAASVDITAASRTKLYHWIVATKETLWIQNCANLRIYGRLETTRGTERHPSTCAYKLNKFQLRNHKWDSSNFSIEGVLHERVKSNFEASAIWFQVW